MPIKDHYFMKTAFCFFGWWCLISSLRAAAADELLFFPATVENTTLADGTALKVVAGQPDKPGDITRGPGDPEPDNHWHWQEGVGSGAGAKRGVFTASGQPGNNAPMLRTLVAGLMPMTCYQVHGFFWIAGTAGGKAEPHGEQCWDIRLGLSMASIRGFGYADRSGLPDTIGIDRNPPLVFRQLDAPLRSAAGEPKTDQMDDRCLFRVALGVAKTDAKGTLVVYIDDQANDTNHGRTCYDGVGVITAPGAAADVGRGAPGALQLAARAGDWDMLRRELAAGADPNALDTDHLTPLYYHCAAGECEQAAVMLKAGAKPDIKGQKFPPLAAAALAGDARLTKILLDAGASIANTEEPKGVGALFLFNPVEAAITSGSVEVLQLMLDQKPDLDLEHTVYGKAFDSTGPSAERNFNGLVKSCLVKRDAEMAAFLINRGCSITYHESSAIPNCRFGNGSQTLMFKAVMNHPPMIGVIDALTKRGVPLVLTRQLEYDSVVVPWDALSGAVWEGQTDLVRQWLPQAAKVSEDYRIRLTVLAESCGNQEVLDLVKRQFKDVKLPAFTNSDDPVEASREATSGPKGRFQPRTLSTQKRSATSGKKTIAVISAPAASGPAAALAAKASGLASWTVVEREEIHKLLTEKSLTDPATLGTTELSAIGDRLAADVFIIVSRFGSGAKELLQFEAANVRTGLLFDRLIVASKEFNAETFCADYLARVGGKLDSQNGAATPAGITLLDIAPDPRIPDGRTLANVLRAGMLQEIDSIPGLIALTREQMEPIASEKVLKQTGALWGAAWTLEGGLRLTDGDQVELAIRLRSLGKDATSHDFKVSGNPDHPQIMVKEAWRQMAAALQQGPVTASDGNPEQRAATEANRLLREAEWLDGSNRPWEAIPIIDAALYLGADPMKALRLRMRIHWNSRHFWNPRLQFGGAFSPDFAWGYPLWPEFHDYARRWVDEHLELLRLTSETLDRAQAILRNHPDPKDTLADFRLNMEYLINYRTQLVPSHLDPGQLTALRQFDTELEPLVKRLLPLLKSPSLFTNKFWLYSQWAQHFRSLPWFGKALAEEAVRRWSGESAGPLTPLFEGLSESAFDDYEPPVRPDEICDLLEQATTGKDPRFANLRKAELAFMRATGEARRSAARSLVRTLTDVMATSLLAPSRWVSDRQIGRWLPMITSHEGHEISLFGNCISTLTCSPQQSPDLLYRLHFYTLSRCYLASACDRKSQSWKMRNNSNLYYFDNALNKLDGRTTREDYDRLEETMRLSDTTFGTDYATRFHQKMARSRPKQAGRFFGSKGQFPILEFADTLDTRVLADVRMGITEGPAMITEAIVDPKNRHVLWMILQPYDNWDFKLVEPQLDAPTPHLRVRQPWLLAIDCRNGTTLHKINLATIPGLWTNGSAESMPVGTIGSCVFRALLANDNQLLIQISWGVVPNGKWINYGELTSLVTINCDTEEIQVLPKNMIILESDVDPNQHGQPNVAAIGDSFYLVQPSDRENQNDPNHTLWQFKQGHKPITLAETGRRPEESPFDSADREMSRISVDDGRLLVTSKWRDYAYYNPMLGKWEQAPQRTATEWQQHLQAIENKALLARIYPRHRYQSDDKTKGVFSWTTEPGYLPFRDGNGPWLHLPVRMSVPASYQARFQVESDLGLRGGTNGNYEWIAIADMVRSNMMAPSIVNQTDQDIVLTIHISDDWNSWHYAAAPPSLPFLWILDKKEAFAAMKKIQGK